MKFIINRPKENILNLVRELGYRPAQSAQQEFSAVKPLMRANYPRFHMFVKQDKDNLIFNLHLDQKKPSYEGSRAHSGEYQGQVVKAEAERIKNMLK